MTTKLHEKNSRSLVKTLTYRIVIIASDAVIVFAVTHRYDATLAVIIASNFSSTILYYLHERLWNNVHWGKEVKK